MISASLPWPPSTNRIWRSVTIAGRARVLLAADGRDYRSRVARIIGPRVALSGKVAVEIRAYPPDNRRRDLDNTLKASLDALTHAGVWRDDSQIADLRIVRMEPLSGGRIEVEAKEI